MIISQRILLNVGTQTWLSMCQRPRSWSKRNLYVVWQVLTPASLFFSLAKQIFPPARNHAALSTFVSQLSCFNRDFVVVDSLANGRTKRSAGEQQARTEARAISLLGNPNCGSIIKLILPLWRAGGFDSHEFSKNARKANELCTEAKSGKKRKRESIYMYGI